MAGSAEQAALTHLAAGKTTASSRAADHPLGRDAVPILSTEHWSLIASRSLLWNEALNRTATCDLWVMSTTTPVSGVSPGLPPGR